MFAPLVAAALSVLPVTTPDPLAPARDGQVQCYTPNVEQRTCRAIGAYRFEADGRIINDAENMLNAAPLIILHARAEVYIRGEAECAEAPFQEEHIVGVEIEGTPAKGEQLAALKTLITEQMQAGLGNGEYCSTFHPKPDGSLRAVVTLDGEPRTDSDDTILWVRREDGWRVAP